MSGSEPDALPLGEGVITYLFYHHHHRLAILKFSPKNGIICTNEGGKYGINVANNYWYLSSNRSTNC